MNNKRKNLKMCMLVFALVLLIGIFVQSAKYINVEANSKIDIPTIVNEDFFDKNAVDGYLENKSKEQIQAQLNEQVEKGTLHINVAGIIIFPDGTKGEGIANIENVHTNLYNMIIDIELDSTGENVYKSGIIKPGQYIEKISLSKDLQPGQYDANVIFSAVSKKDNSKIGQVIAKVKIVINE